MSCSNCYNGCNEIVSDKCVKYTGIDVPILGIKTGDSLSYVEQQVVDFLVSTLDGSGIKPKIEDSIICEIVKKNLPTCGEITLVDFLKSLIKSVCELKISVTTNTDDIKDIEDFIDDLEGSYTLNCLNDTSVFTCPINVTSTSGTHDIVQAIISKLCCFITYAEATYVKLSQINTIIQNYINSTIATGKYYLNMIPFVAYEVYPNSAMLAKFVNGVGQDEWEKVYFCNGNNGTPDKRGRVAVGVTSGMGGGALSPIVAPGGFNPSYTLSTIHGVNSIILSTSQIPTHNHPGSNIVVELNDPKHGHNVGTTGNQNGVDPFRSLQRADDNYDPYSSGSGPGPVIEQSSTGITITKQQLTIVPEGGSQAHSNVQPGIGCYYIMYIP
jgi:microcystin-dependent protein